MLVKEGEDLQMRPRTAGKVALAVLTILFVLLSIIYALGIRDPEKMYRGVAALTFAFTALTCAISYRYFED